MRKKNGADLYIIQMAVTGDIKVGRSKDVHRRLRQIQTGSPHPLRLILHIPDGGDLERGFHTLMRQRRTTHKGEWFDVGALSELPTAAYEGLDLETQDWWCEPPYT